MEIIKLERVPYGKANTLDECKEYRLVDGGMFSPVGTLSEWKSKFPDCKIEVCEDKKSQSQDTRHSVSSASGGLGERSHSMISNPPRTINTNGLEIPACVSFGGQD